MNYTEYITEKLDRTIKYTEYIAEILNTREYNRIKLKKERINKLLKITENENN